MITTGGKVKRKRQSGELRIESNQPCQPEQTLSTRGEIVRSRVIATAPNEIASRTSIRPHCQPLASVIIPVDRDTIHREPIPLESGPGLPFRFRRGGYGTSVVIRYRTRQRCPLFAPRRSLP